MKLFKFGPESGARQSRVAVREPQQRGLPAVSMERVAGLLRRYGYDFLRDDDGDLTLTGTWDGNEFWFILGGKAKEVLQIRGRWNRTVRPQSRTAALLAVNDWNRDHLWPKAYVRDEGDLVVYSEVSVDFECGVTDSQLEDAISCGLVTAVQMFNEINVICETDLLGE